MVAASIGSLKTTVMVACGETPTASAAGAVCDTWGGTCSRRRLGSTVELQRMSIANAASAPSDTPIRRANDGTKAGSRRRLFSDRDMGTRVWIVGAGRWLAVSGGGRAAGGDSAARPRARENHSTNASVRTRESRERLRPSLARACGRELSEEVAGVHALLELEGRSPAPYGVKSPSPSGRSGDS